MFPSSEMKGRDIDVKGLSDLVGKDVTLRIGKIPVETPLRARLGFGTQPPYEATGNLWVEIEMTKMIKIR